MNIIIVDLRDLYLACFVVDTTLDVSSPISLMPLVIGRVAEPPNSPSVALNGMDLWLASCRSQSGKHLWLTKRMTAATLENTPTLRDSVFSLSVCFSGVSDVDRARVGPSMPLRHLVFSSTYLAIASLLRQLHLGAFGTI